VHKNFNLFYCKAVAVSTEERCFVYDIPSGEIKPVGTKARKVLGKYGVSWKKEEDLVAASNSLPTLYTSRPGQRVWLADKTGVVKNTLLIKDIPEQKRIYLPHQYDRQSVRPSPPNGFKFERIEVLNTGQLVMMSSDSLAIFNTSGLYVEAFVYQENFFRDVSISNDIIFIASKASELFYICNDRSASKVVMQASSQPSFSSQKEFFLNKPPSQASLHKFSNKLYESGTNLFGNLAKLGGSIASKVTDNSIVMGVSEDFQQNYQRNLTSELNTVTKQSVMDDPLNPHHTVNNNDEAASSERESLTAKLQVCVSEIIACVENLVDISEPQVPPNGQKDQYLNSIFYMSIQVFMGEEQISPIET